MSTNRRDLLKIFGLSTAAFVAPTADAKAAPEIIDVPEARPPARPFADQWARVTRRIYYGQVVIEPHSMEGHYSFFSRAIGSSMPDGRYAGLHVTNMVRPSQFPAPMAFAVEKIGFVFGPNVSPGLRNKFAEDYTLRLRISNLIMYETPIAFVFDVESPDWERAAPDPVEPVPCTAFAIKSAAKLGDRPVVIETLQQFDVEAYGEPFRNGSRIKAWAVLEGLALHGIQ